MGKIGAQALSKNPNWKGGRTIASNGYVLVKAIDHPDSDIRGYIYEHRLVAETKLGRRLFKGEIVHHKDGNKLNNSPDNLEIIEGIGKHRFYHRNKAYGRRLPGEQNPDILCYCGCGMKLSKFDSNGRPRKFITGHNMKGKGFNGHN